MQTGAGPVVLLGSQTVTVTSTGQIQSTSGGVRVASTAADVTMAGTIVTGGDVLLAAQTNLSMSPAGSASGSLIIATTGTGDITLGTLSAPDVHVLSGGNILDGNGAAINVTGTRLSMFAAGSIGSSDLPNTPTANDNAIDINVSTVAARAGTGIYLEDRGVAGTVTVDRVARPPSMDLTVKPTLIALAIPSTMVDWIQPARTWSRGAGPVKFVADSRSIDIRSGAVDTFGVRTTGGDILLDARGVTSNLLVVTVSWSAVLVETSRWGPGPT